MAVYPAFPPPSSPERRSALSPGTSPGAVPAWPEGGEDYLEEAGERFFRIAGVDRMEPFLVQVVSAGDHWMFAGSNGAVTAGRGSPDEAIFPYGPQDQLFDQVGVSGGLSLVRVETAGEGSGTLWEPWNGRPVDKAAVRRNLYKNRSGSTLLCEEEHLGLGLRWRHRWSLAAEYGLIRRVDLDNIGPVPLTVRLLDGFQNLLPPGIDQAFQSRFSVLGDAYKKGELLLPAGLGMYALNSIPTDRAEPNEGLRATVAWSTGLPVRHWMLSSRQVQTFRDGGDLSPETDIRGRRGAFLGEACLTLLPGETRRWWTVADTGLDAVAITRLEAWLRAEPDLGRVLEDAVAGTRRDLHRRVASLDGLQTTADERRCWRHYSNALFNGMRGGVCLRGYELPRRDLLDQLTRHHPGLARSHGEGLARQPEWICREDLEAAAAASGDPGFQRFAGEFLPLTFGRRHGDPSRPWNRFSLHTRRADGSPRLAWQGNWRDIFQNWEALLHSFPEFAEAAIFRFLNASTADGYNPYRITHEGFEWETADPREPWSNIGYWGDHQIVYLLRLLQLSARFHPGRLAELLPAPIFTHAEIPYRLRSYRQTLENPRATVDYDETWAARLEARVAREGADGRLLHLPTGDLCRVSLLEKLLVPLLAKVANFVPGGGLWMNTQRPEWNDANNALVGFGVSVVTLAYLRRYTLWLLDLFSQPEAAHPCPLADEVSAWLEAQSRVLAATLEEPGRVDHPTKRRAVMDGLGDSASVYREALYNLGRTGETTHVLPRSLTGYLRLVARWTEESLRANRRPDGLFHSYNLLSWDASGGVLLEPLEEMLEGQVAILSSGLLSPEEASGLLDTLRESRLYQPDRKSYLLYPDRTLPRFLEKNRIPENLAAGSRLLSTLLAAGDTRIVARDAAGVLRFHPDFRNAAHLRAALEALTLATWRELAGEELPLLENLYEATFHHRRFTGRSGAFFAYEGLGSIYWHMVSKLVLAIQEVHAAACAADPGSPAVARLARHYREALAGLGWHASPAHYGAFPTDAYSHTPAHAGAQQPGMTGQVKEDLLVRWGELGLSVDDGCLHFSPRLLARSEFLPAPPPFVFCALDGREETLPLPADSLAFTCCQVPVIYRLGAAPGLEIHPADGGVAIFSQPTLDRAASAQVFRRTGAIHHLVVTLHPAQLAP